MGSRIWGSGFRVWGLVLLAFVLTIFQGVASKLVAPLWGSRVKKGRGFCNIWAMKGDPEGFRV